MREAGSIHHLVAEKLFLLLIDPSLRLEHLKSYMLLWWGRIKTIKYRSLSQSLRVLFQKSMYFEHMVYRFSLTKIKSLKKKDSHQKRFGSTLYKK